MPGFCHVITMLDLPGSVGRNSSFSVEKLSNECQTVNWPITATGGTNTDVTLGTKPEKEQ